MQYNVYNYLQKGVKHETLNLLKWNFVRKYFYLLAY